MNIIAIGANHKTSPIGLRERISFSKKRLKDAFIFLKDRAKISGAVILSTCNRVEVYASCVETAIGLDNLEDFLYIYHEIDKTRLRPYLYRYSGEEAVKHLFYVASGLDSQVLGETEVLGQVKYFYNEASANSFTDCVIDEIFTKAIETGRIVRLKTKISRGNVSIASVAMNLIKREVKELCNKRVLVIGLGEVSERVVKFLSKEGVHAILVSNRTYQKAKKIAKSIGGSAVRFDYLKENLIQADVVISATSSPHTIIKKDDLIDIVKPILVIDLALPRDVDRTAKEIKGVRLFDLDDLQAVVEENIERRRIEAEKAAAIINKEVEKLWPQIEQKHTGLEVEEALLP